MMLPSLVLALGALVGAPVQSAQPQLAVKAVRFFMPDSGGTVVLAFLQVPYVLADPTPGGRIAWETTVEVFDGAGSKLYSESWYAGAPASFRLPEAYGVEPLRLGRMTTATYRIKVSVRDSVSGRSTSAETEVHEFAQRPLLSDLLLASQMRIAASGDTVVLPGEFARGNVRFVTTPMLTLDALTPNLAFLLEAYTGIEASATTRLEIRTLADRETLYRLNPIDQTVPAGGGVIRAEIPLDGIPEGDYELVARVTMGDRVEEQSARFSVGSLEAAMERDIAHRQATRGLDDAYFGSLGEDDLDQAADVLSLIALPRELEVYQANGDGALSVNAKRQFLVQFWAERDQSPQTQVNEYRMAFYDLIERANGLFAESGRNARPGWKTPRGRIYVKYGEPESRTVFPSRERAPEFEIWRYSQGRGNWYIFADRSNFGNFELLKTNDQAEVSAPNWCEILTPQVVQREVEPNLGQQFVDLGTGDRNLITCT